MRGSDQVGQKFFAILVTTINDEKTVLIFTRSTNNLWYLQPNDFWSEKYQSDGRWWGYVLAILHGKEHLSSNGKKLKMATDSKNL